MDRAAAEAPVLRRIVATAQIEWRDAAQTGDDFYSFEGHAAVFNTQTTLYAGQYYTWNETIAPGAFTDILASNPDVHFNIGHDMNRSVARTGRGNGVGGMQLVEDDQGLLVTARLSPADPDVQALAAKLGLGVMDQMSFAFRPGRTQTVTTTDDDMVTDDDTILEVADLIDVCVCARGAYPTTDAGLRQRALAHEAELEAIRKTTITRPPSRASQLIKVRHAAHIKFRR